MENEFDKVYKMIRRKYTFSIDNVITEINNTNTFMLEKPERFHHLTNFISAALESEWEGLAQTILSDYKELIDLPKTITKLMNDGVDADQLATIYESPLFDGASGFGSQILRLALANEDYLEFILDDESLGEACTPFNPNRFLKYITKREEEFERLVLLIEKNKSVNRYILEKIDKDSEVFGKLFPDIQDIFVF